MHFAHADNNVWSEKYFSTPASPSLQTTAVSPAALGFGIPPFSSPPAQEPTGPVQWNHGNFTWITRWIVFSRSPIYIYSKLHFLSYGCKTKLRGSHALDYLNSIHSFIMHWKGGSLKTQTFLGRKNFWPCLGEESQPFSGLWLQQFGRSNRVVAQRSSVGLIAGTWRDTRKTFSMDRKSGRFCFSNSQPLTICDNNHLKTSPRM